jgi:hypothetical protein
MSNLSFEISRKPFQNARSHQNIRGSLKKRCHVHGAFSLLLQERRPRNRMDLHHIGEPMGVHECEQTGLIGGAARVVQVKIVFKVMVRANK